MDILKYISDQSIMGFVQTIKSDYAIVAGLLFPSVFWAIKKFTGWTPWKSDDDLADKIAERFGLEKPKE